MNILVLTPGIRKLEGEVSLGVNPDIIFLTNPLYQKKPASELYPSAKILDENDLSSTSDFNLINDAAKRMSHEWFLHTSMRKRLEVHGINLGNIWSRDLNYAFLNILKAHYLFGVLAKKFPKAGFLLASDGGRWTGVFESMPSLNSRILRTFRAENSSSAEKSEKTSVSLARKIFENMNFMNVKKLRPGGVLFSSAFRFSANFMRPGRNDYYLREVFSFQAFQLASKLGFTHLLPEYFHSQTPLPVWNAGEIMAKADEIFSQNKLFQWLGSSIWPAARLEILTILKKTPSVLRLMDSFFEMLGNLNPSAVLLEEDVCVFNKTLVSCCNELGIPTYVLVHGVPFYDVGFYPPSSRKMLVWGPRCKKRLLEWGIEPDRVIETGAPQYSNFEKIDCAQKRKEICKVLGFNTQKKILMLATQPFRTNENPDFLGTPLTMEKIGAMIRMTLDFAAAQPGLQIILKYHPRENHVFFTQDIVRSYSKEVQNRVRYAQKQDTPSLIAASDVLLTAGSTVYFEGLLLKKPSFIFDEPDRRQFEFITPEFLDIHDPEQCFKEIESALQIQNFNPDIETHFYLENRQSRQIISEMLGIQKENFVSHG